MKKLPRREFLHLAAGAAAITALPRSASALDYPTRPVHVVAGYPAGAGPDIIARLIAQALSESTGPAVHRRQPAGRAEQYRHRNRRARGAGRLHLAHRRCRPTRSTPRSTAISISISGRDFKPVAGIGRTPFVFAANPGFPPKTVPEFIAHAKANPGKINFATQGVGSGLACVRPNCSRCSPARSRARAVQEQLHDRSDRRAVPLAVAPMAQVIEFISDGRLRGIAVTTATRSDALPDVPAIGEFVPGYESAGWYGITAPAGTPADIIAKLAAATVPRATIRRSNRGWWRSGVEPDADDHGPIQQIRHRRNRQMGQGGEIRGDQGGLKPQGCLNPMPDPTAAPSMTVEVPPDADPAIRTIAMPADTNPHGDIFGGWLLCQMDLAGASVAVRRTGGRVVTVAITAMAFHRPVCVGDQVSCYGSPREDRQYLDHHQGRELGAARHRPDADQGDGRAVHLRARRPRRPPAADQRRLMARAMAWSSRRAGLRAGTLQDRQYPHPSSADAGVRERTLYDACVVRPTRARRSLKVAGCWPGWALTEVLPLTLSS